MSAWPIIGLGANQVPYPRAKLAMPVRGQSAHRQLAEIEARHWQRLAATCGPGAWARMTAMVERVDGAFVEVESMLPTGFREDVWTRVVDGTRRHAVKFLRAVA